MRVGFLPIDLARWDQAAAGDLLVVGLWSDVRPLRGAAGLLDWRLCGRVSALIAAGRVVGATDEQLLIPSAHRLSWRLALASGLGPSADFSEGRFRRMVQLTLKTMRGLKLARVAMALPGREGDRIPARRAFEMVMTETEEASPGLVEELTLIEPPAAQKELAELLRKRKVGRA